MKPQMKLGAFFAVPGNHFAGWRHPDAVPDVDMDFAQYIKLAQMAEKGLYDCIFYQDSPAVNGSDAMAKGDRSRQGMCRIVKLEPMTVLAALATVTKNIGLVATATTTYNEPYHIARRFATIDHISGGRAGWNLVTSQYEDEAANFNQSKHMEHGLRYERATEFFEVVRGLWDSWDEDAFPRDKASGKFFDIDKMHFLNHQGEHFSVRGPLNIARPPQGYPVIACAGSSGPGMELAARAADLVFTAQLTLKEAQDFYQAQKGLMAKYGRHPDEIKILPGLTPVIGRTEAEAREKYEQLQDLLPDEVAIASLARISGGLDLRKYSMDGPLPDLPPTNAGKSRQQLAMDLAKRENMTLRQIARHMAAAAGHRVIVGTPDYIASEMEEWLLKGGADGFCIINNYYPGPFVDFTEQVIPLLQKRGIYRTEYESSTLRGNLGLAIPRSRYAS